MQFLVKILLSLVIIVTCTQIGRRIPSLAGLIAVMPLTGLIVLVWLYVDNPADPELLSRYTKGALWGILPTILFFCTAYLCFKRGIGLWPSLLASFAVWFLGAAVHQWLLRGPWQLW